MDDAENIRQSIARVTEVRNVEDFMLVLGEAVPGQEAAVEVLRDGARQTLKATFGPPRSRR